MLNSLPCLIPMSHRKNLNHATKTTAERRAYADDVLGSTIPLSDKNNEIDETQSGDTTGKPERINPPSRDGHLPSYRSFHSKMVDWIDDNLFKIITGALAIIIGILGYVFVELSSLSRENGIAGTNIDNTKVQVADISKRVDKLEDKQGGMAASIAGFQESISFIRKKLGL